jgi:hypothetical protein
VNGGFDEAASRQMFKTSGYLKPCKPLKRFRVAFAASSEVSGKRLAPGFEPGAEK